jgi:hypothetical protein
VTPTRAVIVATPLAAVALALLSGNAAWHGVGWLAIAIMAVWPKRGKRR